MSFILSPDTSKQHINLSQECWNCIYNDAIIFSPANKPISRDAFLNSIICNFWKDANASVELRIEENIKEFEKIQRSEKKYDDSEINRFLKMYERAEIRRVADNLPVKRRGIGKKFNLNKESRNILTEQYSDSRNFYNGSIGGYLHAMFEEYSSLDTCERERIILRKTVAKLEDAATLGRYLSIETGGRSFGVVPYKIVADKNLGYNYLIAVSAERGSLTNRYSSFRLSRITSVIDLLDSLVISKDMAKDIDALIDQKGAAYMLGDICRIKVALTRRGAELYGELLRGRPEAVEMIEGKDTYIYSFDCTEFQAYSYFSRFGGEAVILSPDTLRQRLFDYYSNAEKAYTGKK